jgi:hypothetical protein
MALAVFSLYCLDCIPLVALGSRDYEICATRMQNLPFLARMSRKDAKGQKTQNLEGVLLCVFGPLCIGA